MPTDNTAAAQRVPLTAARVELGDLVAKVAYGNESFVITKNGHDAAVMISCGRFRVLDELQDYVDVGQLLAAVKQARKEEPLSAEESIRILEEHAKSE